MLKEEGGGDWLQTPHQLQFKAQDPKLITEDIYTILNAVKWKLHFQKKRFDFFFFF